MEIILIIFLVTKINGGSSETIKIKFKTLKFLDNNSNNLINIFDNNDFSSLEEKYFYYDLILNNIYSEILIGSPPQKIIGFYSGKTEHFSIISDKCFIQNSKYDKLLSNTFKNISEFNVCYKKYEGCCFAQENFMFESYDFNKNITFDNLKFFLTNTNKNNHNSCMVIGLRLNYQDMFIENPKNFIYYLIHYFSTKKIINSYYWTMNFDNNQQINEGYISIGSPPHIYDPKNYRNKKFNEFNIQARYSTLNWVIQFNQLFLNKSNETIYLKKYNLEGHNCVFYPELNIILSTINYFNLIKNEFFNKFISSNICFIQKSYISEINSTIIEGLNGEYSLFNCDKEKVLDYGINKFYSEFPSINFYHSLLNFTFTLNASDLFYEDNKRNKIFFLIGTKNNDIDQWVLGKTFMKKYQFVFNSEMKTIGYYTTIDNNTKNSNSNKVNYMKLIFIIIIIIMIMTFLTLMVYRYRKIIFKDKKSIALEMELI